MCNSTFYEKSQRLAIYLPSLGGGGAELSMVTLANGIAARGYQVDLVLVSTDGPYRKEIAAEVQVVDLKAQGVATSLPALVCYLKRYRPVALVSALGHANVIAVLARQIASVPTRVVVSERSPFSLARAHASGLRARLIGYFVAMAYHRAHGIIAISKGVADDLIRSIGVPQSSVRVVYNPVFSDALLEKSRQVPEHPFLQPGEPPLILATGRLMAVKDFPALLHAFARLRSTRFVRLMILGEGELRPQLTDLVAELGLQDDVALPGFEHNPYSFMRQASLFVLSSAWEGLGRVLIEAMACGTPVVSTDCPFGPAEILEGGRWGRLVPVGDIAALAMAIDAALDDKNPPDVASRAAAFNVDAAVDGYLSVMLSKQAVMG